MVLLPDLAARLSRPAPVLLDGATGGALEDRGIDTNSPLWGSVALLDEAGRALNRALHEEYVAAGAEIVIANTHNLGVAHCAAHLAAHPEDGRSLRQLQEELHDAALEDARAAGARWVAGCLASPDTPYATQAGLTPAEVTARLSPQWEVIESRPFDLALFEMLTTESDVRGVAALPSRGGTRGAGLVCDAEGRLLDGFSVAAAVRVFAEAGIELVFVQCTHFTRVDRALAHLVPAAATCGVVPGVYANDGRHWTDGAWHGARVGADEYAACAAGWVAAGARIVGGCCGTGPGHIRALNPVRRM